MRTSRVRSLSWRVFLGVFPSGAYTTKEWLNSQEAKRKEYDGHCEMFLVDPYKVGHRLALHPEHARRECSPAQCDDEICGACVPPSAKPGFAWGNGDIG